ncbi:hypothetical protein SEPCBS57363_006202 [Sporothrix epigloea]|uniref:DNA endonuclease activator Ctp1 C-terminal domain-containing protein n=1 Tax=Sporothrix epigloea TaxID=1892477 RepID=A0ABP0E1R9_9PEZI
MAEEIPLERDRLKQAIDRAFDRICLNVAKGTEDIRDQNNELQNRYNRLLDDSSEAQNRMESEIKALRGQVAALQSALDVAKAARPSGAATTLGGTNSTEAVTGTLEGAVMPAGDVGNSKSMAKLVDCLQKSLEKYRLRQKTNKTQLEAAVALVRKRKAETLSWIQYAESLELKINKLEKKKTVDQQLMMPLSRSSNPSSLTEPPALPTNIAPTDMSPSRAIIGNLDDQAVQAEVSKPVFSASLSSPVASFFFANHAADDGYPEPELPLQVFASTGRTLIQHATQPMMDSTQGEPSSSASQQELSTPRAAGTEVFADRSIVKYESSSDVPEIIWERATKKPKRDDGSSYQCRTICPQTPQLLPVVKKESSSSTQRIVGIGVYRDSQESIDLDEGQLTVQTPRKRHLSYEQEVHLSQDSEDLGENAHQEQHDPHAALLDDFRPSHGQLDQPVPRPAASVLQAPFTPLAPLSTNIRRGTKDLVKTLDSLKRGVESLAEDDQIYTSPCSVSKGTTLRPLRTGKSSRLNSLLNARPTDPGPLSSVFRQPSSAAERLHNGTENSKDQMFGRPPPSRILPQLRDREEASPSSRTPGATPGGFGAAGSPATGKSARHTTNPLTTSLLAAKAGGTAKKVPALRRRPLDQLKMDDFKINPALNDGETFAYSEVVRSRADRANLAGCTDPQCCGKAFCGMAISELDAAGPAHIKRPESLILMERYLGDKAYQLAQMGHDEIKKLWIEARVKELADKFGKHRHRYHRRASPPGFWDTDFPTTQDEKQYRVEAEKVERITVEERYREAIRPEGGRWLFRDE